ncbi:MAG: LysE family transporter [Methanocellales archaeon]
MLVEILYSLTTGIVLGYTGALSPGPVLFATIDASLKRGWIAGPLVVLGHVLIEILVAAVILFGLASFITTSALFYIYLAGGATLCLFGFLTLRGSKNAKLDRGDINTSNPVFAGILTSISNPFFWIWWLTVGNHFVLRGLEIGLAVGSAFVIGHWFSDLSWYTLVSTSFSKGKKLMSQKTYRAILIGCGVFLILFGVLSIAQSTITFILPE